MPSTMIDKGRHDKHLEYIGDSTVCNTKLFEGAQRD